MYIHIESEKMNDILFSTNNFSTQYPVMRFLVANEVKFSLIIGFLYAIGSKWVRYKDDVIVSTGSSSSKPPYEQPVEVSAPLLELTAPIM